MAIPNPDEKRVKIATAIEPKDAVAELPGWNLSQLNYPTFRVTLVAKIMDRLTMRYLADRGDMTYAEWRVLARLGTLQKGGTVGQVADLAWVDRAEVSRAATNLEKRGLTARRENQQDRRTPILYLTEKGDALYQEALEERNGFHQSLLLDLSEEERAQFDGLLAKVGQRLLHLLRSGSAGD